MTVEGPSSGGRGVERYFRRTIRQPEGRGRGEWDVCVCSCRGLVAFGLVGGPAGVGFAHPFQVQALRALGLST